MPATPPPAPVVEILSVDVSTPNGLLAANVAAVDVGGGERVVTVDGEPTVVTSPRGRVWHARLFSINPFVPDELRIVDSYDEAIELATAYAAALHQRRDEIVALQADLLP